MRAAAPAAAKQQIGPACGSVGRRQTTGIKDAALHLSGLYSMYARRLEGEIRNGDLPNHVALILDGNRRWASRNLSLARVGHWRGADAVENLLDWCEEFDIKIITLYALSAENLGRKDEELDSLYALIERRLEKLYADPRIHRTRMRVTALGRIELLPDSIRRVLAKLDRATAGYSDHFLNLALAYGGQDELVDAVRKIGAKIQDGCMAASEIDKGAIESHLYTSHLPQSSPDLVLRTSGEKRLSGFLLWQSAYSELVFMDIFWPEFPKDRPHAGHTHVPEAQEEDRPVSGRGGIGRGPAGGRRGPAGRRRRVRARGGAAAAAPQPPARDPLVREPRAPGSARRDAGRRGAPAHAPAPAAPRGRPRRGAPSPPLPRRHGRPGRGAAAAPAAPRGRPRRGATAAPAAPRAARPPRGARAAPAGRPRRSSTPSGSRGKVSVVSAGAVIFRDTAGRGRHAGAAAASRRGGRGDGARRYLLLYYPSGHWDFVKGKVEAGESLRETVVREAREETGIADLEFVGGFEESIRYRFRSEGRTVRKKVIFYLARTMTRKIALSDEHVAYEWLTFDECLSRATFNNAKSILLRAEGLLLRPQDGGGGGGGGGGWDAA